MEGPDVLELFCDQFSESLLLVVGHLAEIGLSSRDYFVELELLRVLDSYSLVHRVNLELDSPSAPIL